MYVILYKRLLFLLLFNSLNEVTSKTNFVIDMTTLLNEVFLLLILCGVESLRLYIGQV
jgi:hypothetical protein